MNSYIKINGIYFPKNEIVHRSDEYDEESFSTLREMQDRHFWYQGRHRFLLRSVDKYINRNFKNNKSDRKLSAIDLGCGVGGWVTYLAAKRAEKFHKIALADSSPKALEMSEFILPDCVDRYQIDLMNLQMYGQWDLAFLLDVIEHLPNDLQAISQASESLKSGGYLFVTAPAFPEFWTYNDDLANHLRRYKKKDFLELSKKSGLKYIDARYFMFFLSPLYLLSRCRPSISKMSIHDKKLLMLRDHQVPQFFINQCLKSIFFAESPLGHKVQFPWGTSILGIFQKP